MDTHRKSDDDNDSLQVPTAKSQSKAPETIVESRGKGSFENDRLERYGRWLLSIPRDEVLALQQTVEYGAFVAAFERLGHAHRKSIALSRSRMHDDDMSVESNSFPAIGQTSSSNSKSSYSFLQHLAVDDVVLRVFEFLECLSLARTSVTCSRFRELAHKSASQRTQSMIGSRLLSNVMKLLRANEQIDGVHGSPHVRVPMLGLSRRIRVSNSGDVEYNGVYFCTGSNGNGFVFTKPRNPERRVGHHRVNVAAPISATEATVNAEGEPASAGNLLRCVIARRFSNEQILWYMSKEVARRFSDESANPVVYE
eukprot:CAMPEP_0118717348 /NCGR_PEP_ID=MMETSP0800-20121206/28090_1 /TAXON_ID=210618 ORGANISM="Striatella unipunctata, Strain CCMP2910" /NCGR_SAMPLE_ID=MMETSP0800 /ASSEMBLY_ACC=CAM_ASM_000638 /LENGTH=310 /DNA_ID=CAMNT_0006624037 /DNA_START=131 /DNA_END=1063 /DNA_ORIENTATION=-